MFGFNPTVAFLSHSTFGQPITSRTKHIRDAVEILKQKKVDFDSIQQKIKNKEYSIEKHKQEFEKEITENNMTLDDLTKKGFYDNIEIFYETYGDEDLQPSAKRQKK